MKQVIFFVAGGVSIWIVSRWGFNGLLVAYMLGVGIYFMTLSAIHKRRQVKLLKEWGLKVGPIAIFAENPHDPEQVRNIYLETKRAKDLLKRSGNNFAYVVPFYFQDQNNVNETPEQYLIRVEATMAKERQKSLPEIHSKEGESFYLRHVAYQRGVE